MNFLNQQKRIETFPVVLDKLHPEYILDQVECHHQEHGI